MANWFIVNIPFFILMLFMAIKIVTTTKRGMVKELCSVVSTIVASVVILLISFAVSSYMSNERIVFIITIILLLLLITIYKVLDLALTTLKIISKLPVVSLANKLLGIPFAIAEVIVIIWTIFCMTMVFNQGAFADWIINCVRNNAIMKFLYEYNYLYLLISKFSNTLSGIDFWGILGM